MDHDETPAIVVALINQPLRDVFPQPPDFQWILHANDKLFRNPIHTSRFCTRTNSFPALIVIWEYSGSSCPSTRDKSKFQINRHNVKRISKRASLNQHRLENVIRFANTAPLSILESNHGFLDARLGTIFYPSFRNECRGAGKVSWIMHKAPSRHRDIGLN